MILKLYPLLLLLLVSCTVEKRTDIIHTEPSEYGDIHVVERDGIRSIIQGDVCQGAIHIKSGQPTQIFSYAFRAIANSYFKQLDSLLVIGLGAGFLPMHYKDGCIVSEIDIAMVNVARDFFGFDGIVYLHDGRWFIENFDNKYNCIMLDAFTASGIPSHLFTLEAFQAMKKRLTKDGVLIVNAFGGTTPPYSKPVDGIHHTLKAVFKHAIMYRDTTLECGNVFFSASDSKSKHPMTVHGIPAPLIAQMDGLHAKTQVTYYFDDIVITDEKQGNLQIQLAPVARWLEAVKYFK